MPKYIEIFRTHENSDGVWRGYGKPVFKGTKAQALDWMNDYALGNSKVKDFYDDGFEFVSVTSKKGFETKRELLKGLK